MKSENIIKFDFQLHYVENVVLIFGEGTINHVVSHLFADFTVKVYSH